MNRPAPERPGESPRAESAQLHGGVLVRNTTWTLIGRVAFLFGWAIVTPAMLARLGTDRFAIWSLLFALSGYFATFDLGLSQALVKFVAEFTVSRDRSSLRALVTLGTWVYTALGALAVIALALWRGPILDLLHTPPALRAEAGWSLVGTAVVLGLANLTGVLVAVLNGRQRMDVTGRVVLWGTLVQIFGVLIVLWKGWGLRGLVLNAGIAQVAMGLGYWRATRTLVPELAFDASGVSLSLVGRMFRYSAALQVTTLGTLMQFQFDKLLLAHFAALASVAQFELGVRLCSAAWVFPMLLLPPLIPAFSHLSSAGDRERMARLYWRASRYLVAASLPLAAFLAVGAPTLVVAWLGPGHRPVAVATAAIGGFLLITVLTGVCTAALRGMDQPWLEARYHVTGTVLHLGLSLWLVPRYGLNGALGAMLGSGVVAASYLLWGFHRRLGEPLGRWLSMLGWPLALSLAAAAIATRWPGAGWSIAPAGRLDAAVRLGELAVVFLTTVAGGYMLTRFVPYRELRSLAGSALGGALADTDPR